MSDELSAAQKAGDLAAEARACAVSMDGEYGGGYIADVLGQCGDRLERYEHALRLIAADDAPGRMRCMQIAHEALGLPRLA